MPAKPTTFDGVLATFTPEQRAAPEKLRKIIQAAAPKAEECISYGLAAFRLNGKPLVGLGASQNHCAFYPMNGHTVEAFKDDLEGYDTSKGTIRFPTDKPLPAALVRKLVKARIAENLGQQAGSGAKSFRKTQAKRAQTDPAVIEFLRELDHPLKKEIEAVRQIILGVSVEIREGIKWNSPSFRTMEYFATFNLRGGRVWLILHLGAKVKADAKAPKIDDPSGLLKWLAKDRALMTFADAKEVKAKQAGLQAIVKEWIRHV